MRLLSSALFWRILLSSLLVVGILGFGLYRATSAHRTLDDQFNELVRHDLKLADDAEVLLRITVDLETGKAGYLLTGKQAFLEPYELARDQLEDVLKEAKKTAYDGPEDDRVDTFARIVHDWINLSVPQIEARKHGELLSETATDAVMSEGKAKVDRMRAILNDLRSHALEAAEKRKERAFQSASEFGTTTTWVLGVAIVFALLSGVWIARDLAGAAGTLEEAIAATGRLETLPAIPARRDELGAVGASLVKMSALLHEKDSSLRETLAERERTLKELTAANASLAERDASARAYAEFVRQLKTLDVSALAVSGLNSLVRLADAHIGVVYLFDGANRLVPVHAASSDSRALEHKLFGADGLPRTVMTRREPMYLAADDLGTSSPKVDLGVATASMRWVLAQPIAVGDEEAGAIVLGGLASVAPARGEMVRDATRQLAVALHNAWTHDRLREKSVMLAEQGETLTRANKVKTEFLASMSHELRTPLSAILGFADLLVSSPKEQLSPRARESLDRIKRNGEHLLALINDVLDLAKAEAGHTDIRLASTNVSQLARACLAEVDSLRAGKDVRLVADMPDLPIETMTDSQRVRQILLNLLSNAIKFTEQGEVTVSARAAATEIRLSVKDTGIGISQSAQKELFQEFHQLEKGDGRRYEGTGIGLALSRRLARALGGDIEVRSREDEGSVFTLILPRVVPSPDSIPSQPPPPPSEATPLSTSDIRRALS